MTAPPESNAKPAPAQQTSQITGRDLQFLPAALEILETPAPPASVAFMLTICGFAAAGIVWSFLGHLDVNAVAPGKIGTLGHAKVIEAVDLGKVTAINVVVGATVHAGDLLLELDPAEGAADRDAAQNALISALAEKARREFAIQEAVPLLQFSAQSTVDTLSSDKLGQRAVQLASVGPAVSTQSDIAWDAEIPQDIRSREEAVLKADLSQLTSSVVSIQKQSIEKQATIARLTTSLEQDQIVIDTLTERVTMYQDMMKRELGSKTTFFDAQVELKKYQAQLAADQGQLKEAQAALDENRSEVPKAVEQFTADNENKLADAAKRADDAKQAVNKAEAHLGHTKLYAPVDGIVERLAATTIGQVFTTGQQIMVITPAKPVLQVEALVPNTDIGFLSLGQQVVVKVDAFPFTRFGTVTGHIIRIAAEAEEETDAKRQLTTALASANEASSASGGAPGQAPNFVFPITVSLDQTSIPVDGVNIPLSSGMTVVAEIRTGQRRIIDYLLSPLTKVSSEAFKER